MTAGRKEPVIPTPAPAPMPASPRPTVAARMNRLPITSWHRRATIAIGLGLFFDIYEVFLSGVLVSVLGHQFHLDSTGMSLLLASAFLGMFLGALTLGRLADRLGRRPAFLLALSIYSMFSLVGAFSVGPVMLVVSRFFAGLGIGAEPPISDTYLADLLPPKQRGKYMASAYTLSFAGVPLAGFLAHWLVPIAPLGFDGWRWMFVVGALGAVIVFALRTGLPESPRWLESVGRTRDAEVVVARFEEQARAAGDPLPEPALEAPAPTPPGNVRELFVPPYRRRTLMMAVFHLFQTWGYYGFGTLAPIVLVARGYSIVDSLLFSAVTFLGYPLGSALSVPLVERFERKYLVIGAALGMAAFGLAFGSATSTPVNTSADPYDLDRPTADSGVRPQGAGTGKRSRATRSAVRSASTPAIIRSARRCMFCAALALVALARILSAWAISALAWRPAFTRSRLRRRSSVSRCCR